MEINLKDFLSVSDSIHLDTEAFQSAINQLSQSGGGKLIVPAGKYYIGTVQLKSNITLELLSGAEIYGSKNLEDYYVNGYVHNELGEVLSLFYAINEENICVFGNGSIHFNGSSFMNWNEIFKYTIPRDNHTQEELEETVVQNIERPNQPIFFHNCSNITFSGISLIDASCWTLTFSECNIVKVIGITINNHMRIPNNDGIHITASCDVIISNCQITCGDDCIAITCITNWDVVCRNITVSNCVLKSRSAGVRCGHRESKVKNVILNNLVISETNRGICMFVGENAFVEDVIVSDIIIHSKMVAGAWWGNGEAIMICGANSNGHINNVIMSNVIAYASNGVVVIGENNIKNVIFKNWRLTILNDIRRDKFDKGFDLLPLPCISRPNNEIIDVYIKNADVSISDFLSCSEDDQNRNVLNYGKK